jgi:hypothetical protein
MSKVSIDYILNFNGRDGFDSCTIKDASGKNVIDNFSGSQSDVDAGLSSFFESAVSGVCQVHFYKSKLVGVGGAKADNEKPRIFTVVTGAAGASSSLSGTGLDIGMIALYKELEAVRIDALRAEHRREIEGLQGQDKGAEVLSMLTNLLSMAKSATVASAPISGATDEALERAIRNLKKSDPAAFANYRNMIIEQYGKGESK